MLKKWKINNRKLGLIGKNIDYSFSRAYFKEKFKEERIQGFTYENFDLKTLQELPSLLFDLDLIGSNVTIPYKEEIIPYLDELSPEAQEIGAVNTIKKINNRWKGFNTDAYAFQQTLLKWNYLKIKKALILGSGGASKAIRYTLKKMNIDFEIVSRSGVLSYNNITESKIKEAQLIVNCTPLGTFPNTHQNPDIPYNLAHNKQLFYDLVYNPKRTIFLNKATEKKAHTQNGYEMLVNQAEKSWSIWNEE